MVYTLELLRKPGAAKDDSNGFVYVVHLSGNFVLEVVEEFQVLFNTLLTGGMKNIALDLADLRYIDSTGIGVVITSAKHIRAKSGDLVLLHVTGKILEIITLVKLGEFIPSFLDTKQVTEHFFSRG